MTNNELYDYLALNTYKVIESENPQHPVGKLFIMDMRSDIICLCPLDLGEDRVLMKLRLDSYVDEYLIKANGITLTEERHDYSKPARSP